MISTSAQAVPGTRSAGLNTTVLPKASAGAIFQAGMAMGKFHGQIRPTTPSGSRVSITSTPGRTDAIATPSTRSASCAKNLKIWAARMVSAMPLASGFPSSRDSSRPISSLRARSSMPMASSASALACGVLAAQPGWAALAAAMAASACARVGLGIFADHVGQVRRIDVLANALALDPFAIDVILVQRHDAELPDFRAGP